MAAISTAIKEAEEGGKTAPCRLGAETRAPEDYFVRMSHSEEVRLPGNISDATTAMLGNAGSSPQWRFITTNLDQPEGKDDRNGWHMPSAGRWKFSRAESTSDVLTAGHPRQPAHAIHARIHRRIVMWDVGVPLHAVESLSVAFSALADVVHACKLLCFAGYNHGDLSTGNIIVDVEKELGRLGDLEFAKLHGVASASHNKRTGTPDFMATEVLCVEYLFGPRRAPHRELPFRHNAGHDLESILWIAVFMLYNSLVFEPGEERGDLKKLKYRRFLERRAIFNNQERKHLLVLRGLAPTIKDHIKNKNRAVELAYPSIAEMEDTLTEKYDEFEIKLTKEDRGEKRNHEFLPVHDVFERTLRQMSDLFKGKDFVHIGVGVVKRPPQEEDKTSSEEGENNSPAAKRQKLVGGRRKAAKRKH